MSWAKLDDHFPTHPKMVKAGGDAGWLHVCALCYCAEHLTDGIVPKQLVGRLSDRENPEALAERLVECNVWIDRGDSYELHGYLDYNPSRASVEADREHARRRRELAGDSALTRAIKERDGDRCRYCGTSVSWTDRRGQRGATYDHITPRGPNTMENVVIACRACNMRKGDRTPAQARMELIAIDLEPESDLDRNQPPVPVPVPVPDSPNGEFGATASKPRKKAAHPLPDGWNPSEATREWAKAEYPRQATKAVLSAFMDHAKATDRRQVDWDSAFRNWIRNEAKWHPAAESKQPTRVHL